MEKNTKLSNIQSRVSEFLKLQKQQDDSGVIEGVPKPTEAELCDDSAKQTNTTTKHSHNNNSSGYSMTSVDENAQEVKNMPTTERRTKKRAKRMSLGLSKEDVAAATDTSKATFAANTIKTRTSLVIICFCMISGKIWSAEAKSKNSTSFSKTDERVDQPASVVRNISKIIAFLYCPFDYIVNFLGRPSAVAAILKGVGW